MSIEDAPGRGIAVSILGGFTVLVGLVHIVLAGTMLYTGLIAWNDPSSASDKPWGFVGQIVGGFLIALAALPMLEGLFDILAGVGTLYRKRWGQVLALIVAVLSLGWGVLGLAFTDGDPVWIVLGALHLAYAVIAIAILFVRNSEFTSAVVKRDLGRSGRAGPNASGTTGRSRGRGNGGGV